MIFAQYWIPDIEPVGIIQFIHGLYEHAGRYQEAAEFFTARGYICVINDLLGHGNSAAGHYGFFGYNDGLKHIIEDVIELKRQTREKFPDLPYFVIGSSLGSFIERLLLTDISFTSDIKGAVIAATIGPLDNIDEALEFTKNVISKEGPKGTNDTLNQEVFKRFQSAFPDEDVSISWLTSIKGRQSAYAGDKKATFSYTNSAVRDLLMLLQKIQLPQTIRSVEKRLPILFISGKDDPVGNFGVGIRELVMQYIEAGIDEISMRIFPRVRHDVLYDYPATQNIALPYLDAWLSAHL